MDATNILFQDSLRAAPIISVTILGLIVLLIHSFKKNSERLQFWVSLIGSIICIVLSIWTYPNPSAAYSGMLLTGGYANLFAIIFLIATAITFMLSYDYLQKQKVHYGEYYVLILFAVVGMMAMAAGLDLIVTFIGLELLSVCLYVLAGFLRSNHESNEASLTYFLLGAFSTGFLLYGIALIYGVAGTTNITKIINSPSAFTGNTLFLVGCGLLLIGFAFKVAAVPFHTWVPDVYEGAPTSVTAFMSTGAKSAAFAAIVLIFTATFKFLGTELNTVVAIISAASMIIGNVVAIAQTNIKRMLAYSSIAHAGYMLIGIAAGSATSIDGIIFYLISYTLTNLGAFGIVSVIESDTQSNLLIEDYNGLGYRKPFLAAMMSIFMFSLAGIPPFAGFFGKYYVFYAAIQQGYTWLVILGVLTSVISVYFYLRIVVVMYFREAVSTQEPLPANNTSLSMATHILTAAGVLLFGIFPSLILDLIKNLFVK